MISSSMLQKQLIYFRSSPKVKSTGKFYFSGHLLDFSDTVTHLGHVLHYSLDGPDIKRATLEMCKKANIVLSTSSACDPHVKTVLFSSHCLSYGGVLWDITCNQIKSLEVAFLGVYGSYSQIATLEYSIKLHVLTVF